jgi:hypothetical protein
LIGWIPRIKLESSLYLRKNSPALLSDIPLEWPSPSGRRCRQADEGILKLLKLSIKILSPTNNGLNAWSYLIRQKAYVKTAPAWKLKYGTRLDHDDFKDLNSEDNVLLVTIL